MTTTISLPLKALMLAAALAAGAAPALAEAHPRARVGVWVGGPFWWGPGYWGPGYWGPPVVVERPVIVQPAEPLIVQPSATQENHLWYYCRDAQMYYPYVTSCPSPWQEVPATPPAAPAAPAAPAVTTSPATPLPAATGSRTAPAPVPPAAGTR